ncbi:dipeptide ABC transporter ATP-binding protein [Nocardioides insulae]|uniref:dipeptide ABC transporter ATP-binding protein n=1 Tax=Nocardioides insulae TaxID=394734 RepID=UPI000417B171|nr:ABC transporter ATP-binding protein [Nocardioides insulae]
MSDTPFPPAPQNDSPLEASAPTRPVLDIDHLAISFAHPRPAVREVSVTVHRGEIVALVGESGSGKSMTARAVLGLLPPGARASGSIRHDGYELLGLSERDLDSIRGRRIAMVFQEPQTALNPVRTIGWQLAEALRAHGGRRRRATLREQSLALLEQVEIPEPERRLAQYPHQLSGGQKQRVVLAMALAHEPAVLLADEPTTALDVTVQAEILTLLDRIRVRTGTAVVLITHNMGVVAAIADRVVVLQAGLVVEEGETSALFAGPREPYTRALLDSVLRLPASSPGSAGPAGTVEVHEPPTEPVRSEGPSSVDPGSGYAELVQAPPLDPAAVEFRGVHVRYGSAKRGRAFPAVQDVSLRVGAGEVMGLVGESGSGKTTLGRTAAGLVPVAEGDVLLSGVSLTSGRRPTAGLQRGLAFVHQDPEASLDPRLSVGESIREPLDVHRVGTPASRTARVGELLDAVHLPPTYAARRPRELSGGQRQRIAFARALALRPRLLIADEPTSALDVSVQARVLRLFSELQTELGFACLFISHDLAVVHEVAHRVAVLRAGRLVETGPVGEVFTAPREEYTRRLLAAVPSTEPRGRHRIPVPAMSPLPDRG